MTLPMSRPIGAIFAAALVGYLWLVIRQERRTEAHGAIHDKSTALLQADAGLGAPRPAGGLARPLLTSLTGLALVILGGSLLVSGAVALARQAGIEESVIGLTIVAVGTSMPELVTSVIAALKRQGDVAFGNIVGSNIYNILGIGGATALIAPGHVPADIAGFDAPLMVGVSAVLLLFAMTGRRICRLEGLALLAGYGIYVWALWP